MEIIRRYNKKFKKKKLGTRKVEEKFQHAYVVGNPFLTMKIYNGF